MSHATAPGPGPGDPVRLVMTKWEQRPHWEYDAVLLGSDAHGDWLGVPAGTPMARPGASYVAPTDQVVLLPTADGSGGLSERGWVATFHAAGAPVGVYVDIATPPVWEGPVVRSVDLDLDVLRGTTGRVWVDDEDEFAQARVELGYPAELVGLALRSCAAVQQALLAGAAPFDGRARRWLAALAGG